MRIRLVDALEQLCGRKKHTSDVPPFDDIAIDTIAELCCPFASGVTKKHARVRRNTNILAVTVG